MNEPASPLPASPHAGIGEDEGHEPVSPELGEAVYAQLRRIARRQLANWGGSLTVSPTTMVHEAYLRMSRDGGEYWGDRAHFLAVASRAMRQLLVDKARRRNAAKRGGGALHLSNEDAAAVEDPLTQVTVLSVDAALDALARHDPSLERVVECRFFAGLSVAETALALDRSVRSIERDWTRARAYLLVALTE